MPSKPIKHKMRYTYQKGRVRVHCTCGTASVRWQSAETRREDLKKMLEKAHR